MRPPAGFSYIDAHTHLHPDWLSKAIRRWFAERSDWKLTYPTEPDRVAAFLRERGVERFVYFSYAHKPGIAREINRWLWDTGKRLPDGIPLGTVHPGDDDPLGIVEEALMTYGFRGLKIHIPVQRFAPDDPRMLPIYARLVALDRVLVIHVAAVVGVPASSEPVGMERFARVLERFPEFRACICRKGAPETSRWLELLGEYPHLYLDTTMAMSQRGLRSLGIEVNSRRPRAARPVAGPDSVRKRLPESSLRLRGGTPLGVGGGSALGGVPEDFQRQRPDLPRSRPSIPGWGVE